MLRRMCGQRSRARGQHVVCRPCQSVLHVLSTNLFLPPLPPAPRPRLVPDLPTYPLNHFANVVWRTHAAPGRYARHATPTDMSKELSNQQISRRGPYINSGSNDIGPTPDGFATSARARRTAQTRQRGSAEN